MIKTIDEFLNNWKVKAKEFYLDAEQDYKLNKDNFITEIINGTKITAYERSCQHFNNKYGKGTMQVIKYEMNKIDEILKKEAEGKKIKLITTVEKKSGKIIDTNLEIGIDGSLNGMINGETKTVKVTTVYAGGYNIQCLHYRILVK